MYAELSINLFLVKSINMNATRDRKKNITCFPTIELKSNKFEEDPLKLEEQILIIPNDTRPIYRAIETKSYFNILSLFIYCKILKFIWLFIFS